MTRMKPDERRAQILDCALKIARDVGYRQVDRGHVSRELGISRGTINTHFGTLEQFRRAIMRAAIAREDAAIIAQGLAARDRHAQKAPEALRQAAIATL